MSNFLASAIRSASFGLMTAAIAFPVTAVAAGSRPSDVAGRYAILRAGDKDTGCMLTLHDRARGPGGFKAQLAPACRDQGIVIFDPVGWSLERGRLALTARKGHKAHFEAEGEIWRRDANEGKPLALKPL
jgi:hypothetical protein